MRGGQVGQAQESAKVADPEAKTETETDPEAGTAPAGTETDPKAGTETGTDPAAETDPAGSRSCSPSRRRSRPGGRGNCHQKLLFVLRGAPRARRTPAAASRCRWGPRPWRPRRRPRRRPRVMENARQWGADPYLVCLMLFGHMPVMDIGYISRAQSTPTLGDITTELLTDVPFQSRLASVSRGPSTRVLLHS